MSGRIMRFAVRYVWSQFVRLCELFALCQLTMGYSLHGRRAAGGRVRNPIPTFCRLAEGLPECCVALGNMLRSSKLLILNELRSATQHVA